MTQEENFSIFSRSVPPSADEMQASGFVPDGIKNDTVDKVKSEHTINSNAEEQQMSTDVDRPTDQQSPEETLTEEQVLDLTAKAEEHKSRGNDFYSQMKYEEAITQYEQALGVAPLSAGKQRAIYLANIAACEIARERWKDAVDACNVAVEDDPTYVKAWMRRSMAFQKMDDLDRALTDAKKVQELDSSNAWASKTVKELEPIVKERHEKLKDEMLGKLKDLGNTILGKFGLSLDNFKAEKDPGTGSYSIKFQQ